MIMADLQIQIRWTASGSQDISLERVREEFPDDAPKSNDKQVWQAWLNQLGPVECGDLLELIEMDAVIDDTETEFVFDEAIVYD